MTEQPSLGYTEDALRDLLEGAQLLDDLTAHPGWTRLQDILNPQIRSVEREIVGGVTERDAYAERVGWLKGVRHFLDAPAHAAAQAARARQT